MNTMIIAYYDILTKYIKYYFKHKTFNKIIFINGLYTLTEIFKFTVVTNKNIVECCDKSIYYYFEFILQLQNKIRKSPALNQIHSIEIGLKKSLGEIIFLLDGDDFYKKNKLNNIIKLFLNEPDLQAVCDTPIIFPKNKRKFFSDY